MLRIILHYLSLVFPHTSARLAHWHLLFVYGNTERLDLQNVVIAILPSCIYHIESFPNRQFNHDDDDEENLLDRPGPFRIINDCLKYWSSVYKAFDLLASLNIVLSASGFWMKALLAIDLLVEGTVVIVAKTVFFLCVGVFVGAALEGFPFMKDCFIGSWMTLQFVILGLQDLWEELWEGPFDRNEGLAEDPLYEEDNFEEDEILRDT